MKTTATPLSDLSACLIDENYRQMGCDGWSRDRFWRLCATLDRTPREIAALLRISGAQLDDRLRRGFSKQDGVILTLMEMEMESILSGKQPTRGLFAMIKLEKAAS